MMKVVKWVVVLFGVVFFNIVNVVEVLFEDFVMVKL